jgi:hypothetical protein
MSDYLYEKDLTTMKYDILKSCRHDRVIREISADLGISGMKLRRYIMSRFDMLLMENLPARYDQGRKLMQDEPCPDRELGSLLYSRAVPIIEVDRMNDIIAEVRGMMNRGIPEKEAVDIGKKMIREAITG